MNGLPYIELSAALFGVLGTLLLAGRSRWAGWGFVGWTRVVDCVTAHASPWKTGYPFEGVESYGFVLRDSRPMPFVPWKGRLGFFNVPKEAIPS